MADQLQAEIDQALRGGNPDDAARVIMLHRKCSLDEARTAVREILAKRRK